MDSSTTTTPFVSSSSDNGVAVVDTPPETMDSNNTKDKQLEVDGAVVAKPELVVELGSESESVVNAGGEASGQGGNSVVSADVELELDQVELMSVKDVQSARVELGEQKYGDTGFAKGEQVHADTSGHLSVDDSAGEITGTVMFPGDEELESESAADLSGKAGEVVRGSSSVMTGKGEQDDLDVYGKDVEELVDMKESYQVESESLKYVESEQNYGLTSFVKDVEENVVKGGDSYVVEENRFDGNENSGMPVEPKLVDISLFKREELVTQVLAGESKEAEIKDLETDIGDEGMVSEQSRNVDGNENSGMPVEPKLVDISLFKCEEPVTQVLAGELKEAEIKDLETDIADEGMVSEQSRNVNGNILMDSKDDNILADVIEQHHENVGTKSAVSTGESEFSGLVDGDGNQNSTAESHGAASEPTLAATYDKLEKDIEEEFIAAISRFQQAEKVELLKTSSGINSENEVLDKSYPPEFAPEMEVQQHIDKQYPDEDGEAIVSLSDEVTKSFFEEIKQGSGSGEHNQLVDGEIVTESDEEADSEEDGNGKEILDSAALTALLKAATGGSSDGGGITITSQDGSRLFSVERPAGLGSSLRSLKSASRPTRPNFFSSFDVTSRGDSENLSEEEKKKLENLQQIRIKFLRLIHRLGYSPEDSMAEQILQRLALIGGMQSGQFFDLESAKTIALQLESSGNVDIDFSLNILVLGKTGTGKSATINSIFGEKMSHIHAFEIATNAVREIVGTIDGIKIRIIDTPGLRSSAIDQNLNRKILASVKNFTKKCPPDIVLYVDRLDTQAKDLNDLPLLRSITSSLGPAIWRNAIVTLTHAASAPPDGPSGSPLNYEVFVAQRSHVVQQSIGQAVGDLRMMNPSMMNPVALVENHFSCRKNRDGQKVLPNGQSWRPQLLLLCYSLKILSEANSLSKAQNRVDQKKLFGFRVRSPPLPYLLSWLLQSRTHPKLSSDQGIDNGDSDVDFDLSDSDEEEEEDEYDQLPPFMPLKKAQLEKLSKAQQKAYFEEYDYRVKLLQKKQWKEELNRIREIKKKRKVNVDVYSNVGEDFEQDDGAPAAVAVPMPDMVLPPSFDGDNAAYRYRFLEPSSQFIARPVLDTHSWDHDCGYDGVNIEQSLGVANRFPAALAVQLTKDKKEFNIHLDSSIATKQGENGSTMAGFDIQHVGKQLGYTLRGETKFKILKRNKTAAGVSVTFLGESIAPGFKLEDQITVGKRVVVVGSAGTVRSQGDAAYGTNLEVRLREADYPIGQNQSSLGLSLVKWRGDLALGANLQSQFSVGRNSKIAVRAGLNNKRSGQISIKTSSSDQLQIALVGIIPVAMAIYKTIRPAVSEDYSLY